MKSIKIFLAVLLLTIGGLIYIGFRSESLLMFEWYEHIGGYRYILSFRKLCSQYEVSQFVKYSLPDGLWLLSYMILIGTIWGNNRCNTYRLFIYSMPLIAVILELLQSQFSVLGTFDVLDILSYILAITIYGLIQLLV